MGHAPGEAPYGFHLLGLSELLLKPVALGQVMNDAGEDSPVADTRLTHRKVDRKNLPILPTRLHLPANTDDPSVRGLPIRRQVTVVLVPIRRGHQDADVSADDLALAIAKEALCRGVEGLDGPELVDRDDAVDGTTEDSAQPGLALPKRFLRPLLVCGETAPLVGRIRRWEGIRCAHQATVPGRYGLALLACGAYTPSVAGANCAAGGVVVRTPSASAIARRFRWGRPPMRLRFRRGPATTPATSSVTKSLAFQVRLFGRATTQSGNPSSEPGLQPAIVQCVFRRPPGVGIALVTCESSGAADCAWPLARLRNLCSRFSKPARLRPRSSSSAY